MIEIKQVKYSNRKSISITINNMGEVFVKAPLGFQKEQLLKFINEKKDWILEKQNATKNICNKYSEVINYNKLMVFGVVYSVFKSPKISNVCLFNDKILVPSDWHNNKIFKKFINFYKHLANNYIPNRVAEISNIVGLKPNSILITGSRGRWGACTSEGKIMISWRAALIDKALIDYIIVHELVHLKELNHSPKFWASVEQYFPKYRTAKKYLKEFSFVQNLF